jgi:hypothetical protein
MCRTPPEDVPEIPAHPGCFALPIERIPTAGAEVCDGVGEVGVLAEIHELRCKAMEERLTRDARSAHFRKRVITTVGVVLTNVEDVLDHVGAEVQWIRHGDRGESEHSDQKSSRAPHRIALAGMK